MTTKRLLHTEEEERIDEYFEKGFNENFGFWVVAGGLHPGTTGYKWIGLLFLAGSIVVIVLVGITIAKVYTDIVAFSESANILFYFLILMVICLSFLLQKGRVQFIYRTIGKGFHDYENTLDPETRQLIEEALQQSSQQKKLFVKTFVTVILLTFFTVVVARPILRYTRKEYLVGPPDDGMLTTVPMSVWIPGDKFDIWNNAAMILFQVFMGSISVATVLGHHLFFLSVCEVCATECVIVGLTLKHIVRRASYMKGPIAPALSRCMAHSIRHHLTISRVIDDVEHVVFYPAFAFIGGSTFMICLSGFLFVSDKGLEVKASGAMFLISELAGTLVYCYYGEQVKTKSEDIYDNLYGGDWIENMVILKNYILIVQSKARLGIEIKAGGYVPLSLNTYSNMLSSAFSYFNLLNAVK